MSNPLRPRPSGSWWWGRGCGWEKRRSTLSLDAGDAGGHAFRRLVCAVDDLLVALLHHAALHLERGRQLARLDREVIGEQDDALGPLEIGELREHSQHLGLQLALHRGLRDQLAP